jgi:hypothetical protein
VRDLVERPVELQGAHQEPAGVGQEALRVLGALALGEHGREQQTREGSYAAEQL